jgi:hypothetical protein
MPRVAVRPPLPGLALLGGLLVAAAFASPLVCPDQDPGDLVTRQTARVAVLFWAIASAALLHGRRGFARTAWVVGCGTFVVHVVAAFDRVHGWSHGAAVRHVEGVSGLGAGLLVSYAFTAAWAADAAWWWLDRDGYDERPAWLDRAAHGFLAFVVFNATVVYETGFIRWAGLVVFMALGWLMLIRGRAVVAGP